MSEHVGIHLPAACAVSFCPPFTCPFVQLSDNPLRNQVLGPSIASVLSSRIVPMTRSNFLAHLPHASGQVPFPFLSDEIVTKAVVRLLLCQAESRPFVNAMGSEAPMKRFTSG